MRRWMLPAIILTLLLTLIPAQTIEAKPSQLMGCTAQMSKGSRGPCVVYLQEALNLHGFRLTTDGIFGPATHDAVRKFQASADLKDDGIVGPLTRAALWSSVPTPTAKGPSHTTDCGKWYGTCSIYFSVHTVVDIQREIKRFESTTNCSFLKVSCGNLSEFFATQGICAYPAAYGGAVGGLSCELLIMGLRAWGMSQVNRAVNDKACLRLVYRQHPITVPQELIVTHRNSRDDGQQFCRP